MQISSSASKAFLALGTNLGDRKANLVAAVRLLIEDSAIKLCGAASLHETSPVGGPDGQGDYYNTVISVTTSHPPVSLLQRMLAVEEEMGRVRKLQNDARIIDIDLLLFDSVEMRTPTLTLPHPRMHLRRFVLQPLAELAPDAWHPAQNATASSLLANLQTDELAPRCVHPPDWIDVITSR